MAGKKRTTPGETMTRKLTFLATTFVVFGATVMMLASLDLLPSGSTEQLPSPTEYETASSAVLPEGISIPKIGLTATVANPSTTDTATLDTALLRGAVRYPTSGTLGGNGQNVVIFGHSSYLPVVQNQAFKTFDDIQHLVKGDRILVTGKGKTYVYEVETVAKADASRDNIPLNVSGNKLTLVTCDSFATKSDRFVVIAHLVESYPNAT